MSLVPVDVLFFETPEEFGDWLADHHATAAEQWVGFHRTATGRPSLTWPESVDEALCVGWIDGLRKGLDDESYAIRFTPRKATSVWSAVNVRRVGELVELGRMRPAGLRAFQARNPTVEPYSYGRDALELEPAFEERLRANDAAWRYFLGQPAGYRRGAGHWVMSAKREETRERRLETLIEDSVHERWIKPMAYGKRQAG